MSPLIIAVYNMENVNWQLGALVKDTYYSKIILEIDLT
jgi:hypothetical protein